MSDTEQRYAYVGTCPGCGSMTAACVDEGERGRKYTAKFCAQIIKDGDILNRVTVEEVRQKLKRCQCKPKQRVKQPDMFAANHSSEASPS